MVTEMAEARIYTIDSRRIKKGSMVGFDLEEGQVVLTEGTHHALFLPPINSFSEGSEWGILKMRLKLPEECICILRAFAMDIAKNAKKQIEDICEFLKDDSIGIKEKMSFFENADCMKAVNASQMLLYELKGQYLWFSIEVIGEGEGRIERLRVENPGDNFMQTFPEIYQERGSFFHRYMSIFSSLYGEVQEEIDNVTQWIDPDTAPEQLLFMYLDWLGLRLEGELLQGEVLRKLLKEVFHLNSIKGTKQALKQLIQLMLNEEAVIVERNLLKEAGDREELMLYNRLYGDSKYDITVLLNRMPDDKLHAQMMSILGQFVPVRVKLHLVFFKDCNELDSYCFLDRNAVLGKDRNKKTDDNVTLDSSIMLG